MLRTLALSALVTFAFGSSSHAANVQVNFSGGNGTPLTITLPRAISFTVTNDTPSTNAVFVLQGVGNVTGGSVRASTGSLSYTTNGGSALSIDSVGNFPLGVITINDLSIFKQASPSVGLNDVLLLSAGSVTTFSNVTAAAPPSALYSAIFVDVNGTQLGVGTAVPGPDGDYNLDGSVNAADYVVWRDTDGSLVGYNLWRAHFGQTPGSGTALTSLNSMPAAVPEPTSVLLLVFGAIVVGCGCRQSR